MTLRYYDYECFACGLKKESLEPIDTESVDVECVDDTAQQSCRLYRVTTNIPKHVKIDIHAAAFVPMHTKLARNLGHGGGNQKTQGQYDNESREEYKKKIMVGPR